MLGRRPSQLSGGQQQRVAIARALVKKPKLVIADEPTANLDSKTGEAILQLMCRLNEDNGTTFIFSTHDPMVLNYARRVVVLKDGVVAEDKTKSSGQKDESGRVALRNVLRQNLGRRFRAVVLSGVWVLIGTGFIGGLRENIIKASVDTMAVMVYGRVTIQTIRWNIRLRFISRHSRNDGAAGASYQGWHT